MVLCWFACNIIKTSPTQQRWVQWIKVGRECEKRVGEAGNKGIMLCFMNYFARRWRQFMGLICPHTATSAVCAQLIISFLFEGFVITHQDSDAKNVMKATIFTVKRNACCAFCWSPLHWSEATDGDCSRCRVCSARTRTSSPSWTPSGSWTGPSSGPARSSRRSWPWSKSGAGLMWKNCPKRADFLNSIFFQPRKIVSQVPSNDRNPQYLRFVFNISSSCQKMEFWGG